jgi:mannosyltransferase OCH1-like enzyme
LQHIRIKNIPQLKPFPKIIWFLWLQGLENAPIEVRECYKSWVGLNPDWQVNFIDANNIAQYVKLPDWPVAPYVASELLRINLLTKYGGVWADVTCYCTRPLSEWLYEYMTAGFFAFDKPGPDRMLSSWFIASYPQNAITTAFKAGVEDFWAENTSIRLIDNTRWNFLNKYMQKRDPQLWFNRFFTRVLKVHPYFWFHYTFEHVYLTNATVRKLWDSVPKFSADIPHRLLFAGLFKPINEELKAEINNKISPVYKLTWKYSPEQYKPGTVMYYLFNKA